MSAPFAVVTMVAVLIVTGCATRGAVSRAEEAAARADRALMRTAVHNLRVDVADLRQAHETIAAGLTSTRDEVRALDARALTLESGIRDASEEVGRLRAWLQAADDELRKVRAVATPVAPVPAAVVTPERPPRPPAADAAEQVYSAAFTTFRSREYGQAVLDFLDFIAKFPRHPLAANAQYWIGEAYYVQRDYRQAMTEFRKVVDSYPASSKAADALVKIGLCYTNLRDPASAQQAWQRVVTTYPSTEAAAIAKTLMRGRASSRR